MQTTRILAELFRFNGTYIPKLLKVFSLESFYIKPENRGNPMIWLLGHVVLNRGEIVEMLGGDPQTADLGDLFARGTFPKDDPSEYPEPSELLKRYARLVALTEHLLENSDPAVLDQKSWGQFETLGQNLAYSYMHETHHIGQITYLTNLPSIKSMKKKVTTFRKPDQKNSTTKILLDSIKSVFT
ncbi:MAG: DinB family protein [candidate division Zixibacteria bacterium]